jgi:dienelactone hydrolase
MNGDFMRNTCPVVGLASIMIAVIVLKAAVCDEPRFARHLVNPDSEFSAATAIDINGDGRLDIVSGAWWYESPSWKKHRFRDIQKINGRYDDYSNLPLDIDGDGLLDIVSVNYRSKSLYWSRNPGPRNLELAGSEFSLWQNHTIDVPGTSETGRLVDIDGDGLLDILPNGTSFAAWYGVSKTADGALAITRYELPSEVIGHGIGAGDINGDGRIDIVTPRGWAEGPANPRTDRWNWHPDWQLARDCGLPILCADVDRDGDMDLIWGRGHNIGLYWTEQVSDSESLFSFEADAASGMSNVVNQLAEHRWITRAIDTSWSSAHTLMLADIDGDGRDDLVTGKRYQGHDGKDPGENDPLAIYCYVFQDATKTWRRSTLSQFGTCGIDLDAMCVDLDNDGDMDILAPARCGLHWLENLRIHPQASVGPVEVSAHRNLPPEYPDHIDLSYVMDHTEDASEGGSVLRSTTKRPMKNSLDHGLRRFHALQQMQQAMGDFPETEMRVGLDVHVSSVEDAGRYYRIKLTYVPEPGDRVPAYLLVPKELKKPAAAMLCLHQTHFELGKAEICGLGGQPNLFYAHELAERGFVCIAPDYPGFADYPYDFTQHADRYASGTMKAIWNNVRAIDLLESLPCVNRDQIGAIGHSLGGHNSLFTAAFDQRIRSVITSCGFNAFEYYYGGNLKGWSSTRYMPRIETEYQCDPRLMPFNFPEVLVAIAPRSLFVCAPQRDANFAVAGVRICQESIEPIYELLRAEKKVRFEYPDAEHDFPRETREQAYLWLGDQLGRE